MQVVDCLQGAKIQISGNARAVYKPRNIEEFMNFYDIKHTKTTATFYKAVHKQSTKNGVMYISDYDDEFIYEIGKKAISNNFDSNIENICSYGIHISPLGWALDFGRNWDNLAILEVKAKIKDVLVPKNTNGKVRAPEVEIIREVSLEECGLFGKILAKRNAATA